MIQIVIFSFNRALQLDALLSSILKFWIHPPFCLSVIYNTSDQEFQNGYDLLTRKYPSFSFIKEEYKFMGYSIRDIISPFNLKKLFRSKSLRNPKTNFRELLISELEKSPCPYIMFLTDDSKFVSDIYIDNNILNWISKDKSNNSLSLRLGQNLNDAPFHDISNNDELLSWDYCLVSEFNSWSYPFSVDGHVYHKEFIKFLLKTCLFSNPSSLEANIYDYVHRHRMLCSGRAFSNSKLVSFPINMVQNSYDNESLNISEKMLNDKFIDGYTLDYPLPVHIDKFQQYPDCLFFLKDKIIEEYSTCS